MAAQSGKRLTIGIIGGSLSGLFMGVAMKSLGHKVHIFERHATRKGAGIMITPPMFDFFQKLRMKRVNRYKNILYSTRSVSTDKDSNLTIMDHAEKPRPQTCYNNLFETLFMQFAMRNGNYHFQKQMKSIVGIPNNRSKIIFKDNTEFECDLVIGCDGISSGVRSIVPGNDTFKLDYAGYIAWRGIIPLNCIKTGVNSSNSLLESKIDEITTNYGGILYHGENSQFVGYTVPNNTPNGAAFLSKELNWVWYKSMDKELMNECLIDSNNKKRSFYVGKGKLNTTAKKYLLEESKKELPAILDELVNKTANFSRVNEMSGIREELNNQDMTFLQVILDGNSNNYVTEEKNMSAGRVLLAGDAACVVRPHTVRATSKASFDAMTLYELFIKYGTDMSTILKKYETITKENNAKIMNEAIGIGNKVIFPQNSETRSLQTAMGQNINTKG